MTHDDLVELVAIAMWNEDAHDRAKLEPASVDSDLARKYWRLARAAIAAMQPIHADVTPDVREGIVDDIESIICETHELDVRDRDYADNIVSWLERHHPAALRAIADAHR